MTEPRRVAVLGYHKVGDPPEGSWATWYLVPERTFRDHLELLARDLGFVVAWSELRSGGRDGSATTDALIAFAHGGKWRRAIGAYAEDYQEIARRDWKRFRAAYRDGLFHG